MFFGKGGISRLYRPCSIVPLEGGAGASAPASGVLAELSAALASARATLSNFLDLTSFEARRAGLALMWMVTWGFVAATCIVAAWLGLMVALAMWAITLGCPQIAVVLGVVVMNCVAAAALISLGIGMSRDLLFPATRRQVAGKSPVKPNAP